MVTVVLSCGVQRAVMCLTLCHVLPSVFVLFCAAFVGVIWSRNRRARKSLKCRSASKWQPRRKRVEFCMYYVFVCVMYCVVLSLIDWKFY